MAVVTEPIVTPPVPRNERVIAHDAAPKIHAASEQHTVLSAIFGRHRHKSIWRIKTLHMVLGAGCEGVDMAGRRFSVHIQGNISADQAALHSTIPVLRRCYHSYRSITRHYSVSSIDQTHRQKAPRPQPQTSLISMANHTHTPQHQKQEMARRLIYRHYRTNQSVLLIASLLSGNPRAPRILGDAPFAASR